jgi:flavodoxin
MQAVIVYESMYGNTHHIANAIADGLGSALDVAVVPVDEAGPELVESADLLVSVARRTSTA